MYLIKDSVRSAAAISVTEPLLLGQKRKKNSTASEKSLFSIHVFTDYTTLRVVKTICKDKTATSILDEVGNRKLG